MPTTSVHYMTLHDITSHYNTYVVVYSFCKFVLSRVVQVSSDGFRRVCMQHFFLSMSLCFFGIDAVFSEPPPLCLATVLCFSQLTRRRTRGNLRDGARYCLLAGTLDGGLGAILPVDERVFRRLYALQGIMSNALGHNGAANPRFVAKMACFCFALLCFALASFYEG